MDNWEISHPNETSKFYHRHDGSDNLRQRIRLEYPPLSMIYQISHSIHCLLYLRKLSVLCNIVAKIFDELDGGR